MIIKNRTPMKGGIFLCGESPAASLACVAVKSLCLYLAIGISEGNVIMGWDGLPACARWMTEIPIHCYNISNGSFVASPSFNPSKLI